MKSVFVEKGLETVGLCFEPPEPMAASHHLIQVRVHLHYIPVRTRVCVFTLRRSIAPSLPYNLSIGFTPQFLFERSYCGLLKDDLVHVFSITFSFNTALLMLNFCELHFL